MIHIAHIALLASASAGLGQAVQAETRGVIRDPVLSPDSAMVAYVVAASPRMPAEIWLVATTEPAGPRRLATGEAPSWSRDGQRLAFLGLVGGAFQIWIYDRQQDAARQLTHVPGGIQPHEPADVGSSYRQSLRLTWSPDGSRIAFSGIVEEPGDTIGDRIPVVLTERSAAPKIWAGILPGTFGGRRYINGVRSIRTLSDSAALRMGPVSVQLFVADSHTGSTVQVTTGDSAVFDPAWSPDGTSIAVVSSESTPVFSAYVFDSNLYLVDPDTGRRTALTAGPGRKFAPHWSRDGRSIAYFTRDDSTYRSRGPFVLDVAMRAVRADTGNALGIMPGALAVTDGGTKLEFRVAGQPARILTQVAPRRGSVPRRQGAERLTWIGGRGHVVSGWLRKPPEFDPRERYPLVVDVYDEWQSHDALLSSGYVILSPYPRMPHRLSANHRDSDYRRIVVDSPAAALELGVADVLSGVDTLIARGMVDPERMALVGFSNGGGAVAHIIARTDRFRCAVIQSPAAGGNWGARFFDDPDGIYFQAMLGDRTPWNAPLLYAALSPVYHADRIRTPVLLAVGEAEDFGWVHNAIQLYGALRRLRRPVTLVRYPGQGHGLRGWALEDLAVRARNFIDQCIDRA